MLWVPPWASGGAHRTCSSMRRGQLSGPWPISGLCRQKSTAVRHSTDLLSRLVWSDVSCWRPFARKSPAPAVATLSATTRRRERRTMRTVTTAAPTTAPRRLDRLRRTSSDRVATAVPRDAAMSVRRSVACSANAEQEGQAEHDDQRLAVRVPELAHDDVLRGNVGRSGRGSQQRHAPDAHEDDEARERGCRRDARADRPASHDVRPVVQRPGEGQRDRRRRRGTGAAASCSPTPPSSTRGRRRTPPGPAERRPRSVRARVSGRSATRDPRRRRRPRRRSRRSSGPRGRHRGAARRRCPPA